VWILGNRPHAAALLYDGHLYGRKGKRLRSILPLDYGRLAMHLSTRLCPPRFESTSTSAQYYCSVVLVRAAAVTRPTIPHTNFYRPFKVLFRFPLHNNFMIKLFTVSAINHNARVVFVRIVFLVAFISRVSVPYSGC